MTDKSIRIFLGTMTLHEGCSEQSAAVYTLSAIDDEYVADTSKTPCGKVRLKPDMVFIAANIRHLGVLLVPEDKSEAILSGCSMQNNRLDDATKTRQRSQYELGRAALLKLHA